jgi:hypothetical protein
MTKREVLGKGTRQGELEQSNDFTLLPPRAVTKHLSDDLRPD